MSTFVTLVNRTSKPLQGLWDGKRYDIGPGKHEFPEYKAIKFKEQNPVMGSENPYTLEKLYLIGIIEHGDDVSPIEQSDAIERFDRSKVKTARPVEVVPGETGLYARYSPGFTELGGDGNFSKP